MLFDGVVIMAFKPSGFCFSQLLCSLGSDRVNITEHGEADDHIFDGWY